MIFFITGGTGFLGSHFIKYALEKKYTVYAIRRKGSKAKIKFDKQPKWIQGNLGDDFLSILSKCDVLIHFAAHGVSPKKTNMKDAIKYNSILSESLWSQCIKAGIKNYIIIGSSQEYGKAAERGSNISTLTRLKPLNEYGISKVHAFKKAKILFKNKEIKSTYLRIFNAYGEGQHKDSLWSTILNNKKTKKKVSIRCPLKKIDFISVENVVKKIEYYCKFKENKFGKMFVKNIGSGKSISIESFIKKYQKNNAK